MPTKFFLRSDGMAVNPDENHLKAFNETLPQSLDEVQKWNNELTEYINSLPTIVVDLEYLKTLKEGWFEGDEQYEVFGFNDEWVRCTKVGYDKMPPIMRRLTIIAPQEAENCICEEDNKLTQALCKVHNPRPADKGQEWEVAEQLARKHATRIVKGPTPWDQFDRVRYNSFIAGFKAATPQPVTGEAGEAIEDLARKHATRTVKGPTPWEQFDRVRYNSFIAGAQAASRPSDAVEFAEWLDGCGYSRIPYKDRYGEWAEGNDIVAETTAELYQLFLNSKSPNPKK